MVNDPDLAISYAWLLWFVSWMIAAFWRRQAVKRPPRIQELAHLLPTIAGAVSLFATHAVGDDPTLQRFNGRSTVDPIQLWHTPLALGWALLAATVAGFLFCWWARLHLGALWSGSITLKSDHRVVDTGPYRLVRHPIYTGLLLAALAAALEKATLNGFVGLGLMVFGIWLKARFEEGFLRSELGAEAYDSYARRTPMLVPFTPF